MPLYVPVEVLHTQCSTTSIYRVSVRLMTLFVLRDDRHLAIVL